ncbi:unnamed protein product [Nyctereutes procyonoides]|uniref:(raccoon dog) hypothetical protein n=1 Tax=Nyctereutes procyonoides TaxID=34880 RepID=A0A811Y598_NYCPR|nr:unnamed protein product [Nyctereutes procyonoides]
MRSGRGGEVRKQVSREPGQEQVRRKEPAAGTRGACQRRRGRGSQGAGRARDDSGADPVKASDPQAASVLPAPRGGVTGPPARRPGKRLRPSLQPRRPAARPHSPRSAWPAARASLLGAACPSPPPSALRPPPSALRVVGAGGRGASDGRGRRPGGRGRARAGRAQEIPARFRGSAAAAAAAAAAWGRGRGRAAVPTVPAVPAALPAQPGPRRRPPRTPRAQASGSRLRRRPPPARALTDQLRSRHSASHRPPRTGAGVTRHLVTARPKPDSRCESESQATGWTPQSWTSGRPDGGSRRLRGR